jgi:hypothetical protein
VRAQRHLRTALVRARREEWRRFIEGSGWPDTRRLAEHLGLTPSEFRQDWNKLLTCLDHPGVATFAFPDFEKSHEIYVYDIQWPLHHWPHPCGPSTVAPCYAR